MEKKQTPRVHFSQGRLTACGRPCYRPGAIQPGAIQGRTYPATSNLRRVTCRSCRAIARKRKP